MDNREFNVKGKTKEQLALAIKCLLMDEYNSKEKVGAWYIDPHKGFILCSYKSNHSTTFTNRLGQPSPITEEELIDILWDWFKKLKKEEIAAFTKDSNSKSWDHKMGDSDVECDLGWRLYVEEWGHVHRNKTDLDHSSIAAFKPSWCWYGK